MAFPKKLVKGKGMKGMPPKGMPKMPAKGMPAMPAKPKMGASSMFSRNAPPPQAPGTEPDADEMGGPSDMDEDDQKQPVRARAMFGRKAR